MRRILGLGLAVFALSLTVAQGAFAAVPARHTVAAAPKASPTLKWTAPFTKGTLSGTATLTTTASYSSGRLAIVASGVVKGDKTHVYLRAVPRTGKAVLIVSDGRSITTGTGKTSFSFVLNATRSQAVKTDLVAGDSLRITVSDGKTIATGTFAKA